MRMRALRAIAASIISKAVAATAPSRTPTAGSVPRRMRRLRGSEERLRAEEHAQAERGSEIARTPLHDENRKSCHSDKHCLSLRSMPGHKMATTQINFLVCHVTGDSIEIVRALQGG
jgi:hypothetical protein